MTQKRKQPRLKKINVSVKNRWRQILKEINKDEIPVDLLLSITINLIDGTKVKIDIQDLLDEGNDPKILEEMLAVKFKAMDHIIQDIDFLINIDNIAKTVQPITDKILKDL